MAAKKKSKKKKNTKKKTKKKTRKKSKKRDLKRVITEIILGAVAITLVSYMLALMYTGARVVIGIDKVKAGADEYGFAGGPAAEPTKEYKIPAKYKYLFEKHGKKEDIPRVGIKEAKVLFESGKAVFIDARSKREYMDKHIPGSIYMSSGYSPEQVKKYADKLKDKVIVTYCHGSGCRLSDRVTHKLFDMGYRKHAIFFGGWPEWVKAGMPVEEYEPPEKYKHLFKEAPSAGKIKEISLNSARFLYKNRSGRFVDADTFENYKKIHIQRAVSIPAGQADKKSPRFISYLSKEPVVVYCHGSGGKAEKVSKKLYESGIKKIFVFKRALPRWEKAGLPLYKGGGRRR